jgi:hypothetical protein
VGSRADRTYTAALADLDGDGDLDLVVGNDRPDPKVIHLNDGRGRFSPGGTFGDSTWPTRNVTVADFTGDGRPDVVVANRGGPENRSTNYLCVNDGRGRFPECRSLSTASATTIGAADLDGDGDLDLVIPHRDGGQSFLLLNDGSGGFASRRPFGPPVSATRAVALGDLDGDGHVDIVLGSDAGGLRVYRNLGAGRLAPAVDVGSVKDEAYSIAIADLNGDGLADIVVGNQSTRPVVLVQRGRLEFERILFGDSAGAVYGLGLGDLDGDGAVDVVAARSGAPNAVYFAPALRRQPERP